MTKAERMMSLPLRSWVLTGFLWTRPICSKISPHLRKCATLSDSELRLAKYALIQFRNALIAKGLPTEDVNILLLKLYK